MSIESIDVFCHCLPPKYCAAVHEVATTPLLMFERAQQIRVMVDLDARLQMLEEFPGYRQIVSLASPPVELLAPGCFWRVGRSGQMTKWRRWSSRSEGRILGFVASLPLNDPTASMAEAKRSDTRARCRRRATLYERAGTCPGRGTV